MREVLRIVAALLVALGLGAITLMLWWMPSVASVRGWRAMLFDRDLAPMWLAHFGAGIVLISVGVALFLRSRPFP